MIKYKYTAVKNNTEIVQGELIAASPREARQKIRELGFIPTKIYTEATELDNNQSEEQTASIKGIVNSLSLSEKITFTSELETILSSEISILEALSIIENNVPQKKIQIVCSVIKEEIINGMSFNQALHKHYAKVFGSVFISLVKTGEEAGELDITLGRMLLLLKKQEAIKNQIISASIYPSILILMLSGLGLLFTKLVFPKMVGMINYMGAEVPTLAQRLIDICQFTDNFWWLILIVACGGIYGIKYLFQNKTVKKYWDTFVLKIPVISDFVKYINLSNFMTVLHISYEAGVPILSGLELANFTVGNYQVRKQIYKSIDYMKNGKTITEAFEKSGVIPSSTISIVAAGEKSGRLGKMLLDISTIIDKKIEMVLDTMAKLFPPIVLLVLGGIVLFVVLAFMQLYTGMLGSLF